MTKSRTGPTNRVGALGVVVAALGRLLGMFRPPAPRMTILTRVFWASTSSSALIRCPA